MYPNVGEAVAEAGLQPRPLPSVVTGFPMDESPFGVRGVAGNARTWTQDRLGQEGASAQEPRRIVRGGSSLFDRSLALAVYRDGTYPDARPDAVGFRLARSPVPSPRHQNRSG